MKRSLFVLFNGAGRILPAVGVMRALRERGEEVGLVTVPAEFRPSEHLLPQMTRLGVEVFASPAYPPECHEAAIFPGSRAAELVEIHARGDQDFTELRRQRQIVPVLSQIPPLRKLIATYRPDVVVADTLAYQAGIAAQLEGRPWIGYSASHRMVAPQGFVYERAEADTIVPEAKALFEQHGMQPCFASIEYMSPLLNLVFALPELLPESLPNADIVKLVGPPSMGPRGDEVPFPWSALDRGRPRAFISTGTVMRWQPEVLDVIVEAAEPLGIQCILGAGEVAGRKPFPPHVLVVDYAPQVELLRQVDLFVTIGGANSINESLCAGVPMVVMPMLSDQPLQGHLIEMARAGISIPYAERSVARFRDAMARVLDPAQGYRARLTELRELYNRVDGGKVAAAAISALAL